MKPQSPFWLRLIYRPLAFFLRIAYRLLYREMAWTYDAVAATVSLGRWKQWVFTALPYLPGPRVLELGHGPGHLQAALHKAGVHAVGLDASPQMSRQARRRLLRAGMEAHLARGLAQTMPFANGTFRQVAATFPSEYIFKAETWAEIFRVLETGGEAIVMPFAWITGRKPLDRGAAWLFRVTGESPEWNDRWLTPIRQAGFRVSVEWLDLASSCVLLIRAVKP